MELEQILSRQGYVCIPFEMTVTNHLEVITRINGEQGVFLIDTGASSTCIGIDRIERFHLNSEDSEIKAAGAGATDMETAVSTGNRIEIGSWSANDQQIVLFDLGHVNHALEAHDAQVVDGIIGSDLLDNGKAIIDYSTHHIYLLTAMEESAA